MISLSLYNKKTNGEQGLFQLKQKKHTQTLFFLCGAEGMNDAAQE